MYDLASLYLLQFYHFIKSHEIIIKSIIDMEEIKLKYKLDENIEVKIDQLNSLLKKVICNLKQDTNYSRKWITSERLREELGICKKTEANWIRQGILVKYIINRKGYYKLEEVENAMTKLKMHGEDLADS